MLQDVKKQVSDKEPTQSCGGSLEGEGITNPFQYSCWRIPDRRAGEFKSKRLQELDIIEVT